MIWDKDISIHIKYKDATVQIWFVFKSYQETCIASAAGGGGKATQRRAGLHTEGGFSIQGAEVGALFDGQLLETHDADPPHLLQHHPLDKTSPQFYHSNDYISILCESALCSLSLFRSLGLSLSGARDLSGYMSVCTRIETLNSGINRSAHGKEPSLSICYSWKQQRQGRTCYHRCVRTSPCACVLKSFGIARTLTFCTCSLQL